jgi:hypothetical protein
MHTYKNLIFTNHAYARLKDRSISEDAIWQTIQWPEKKYPDQKSTKFIKSVYERRLHVIANWLAQENKWLIISVWVRGEEDKQPIVWQILTLPFRIGYWILKKIFTKM